MTLWGFGDVDGTTYIDSEEEKFDLSDPAVELNAGKFWNDIKVAYGYDLSDEGINGESR